MLARSVGMDEKRVLLIESGRFIGGVIHSLFSHQDHLQVIVASPTSYRELLKAVKKHQPEIIILDDTVRETYLSHLLQYMQISSSAIRVVVLNTDSSRVEVYDKQQVSVNHTADFFAVL